MASKIVKQPVFFISHGGPNLLEDKGKLGNFYTWFGTLIKKQLQPKAIVIISAHWGGRNNDIYVDTSEKPELIYDFGGFPKHYYEETWDHQGSPEIAQQVVDLLKKSNIKAKGMEYGNDHGVWVPLKRAMKSNKHIPIIEVSTFGNEDLSGHIKMGEAISSLREQNILIIGSGTAVHNLRDAFSGFHKKSPDYVYEFDKSMEKIAVESNGEERQQLAASLDSHPSFRRSHPTAEHLVPFQVAIGAAGHDSGVKLLEDYISTLCWSSYAFGFPDDIEIPSF
ncbi:extradiol ring-cleavage dioxygenase [Cunninghamella echinulata]|nr:extradiol ring-cleavage dioxygenase [Cunninghamella echinulata]